MTEKHTGASLTQRVCLEAGAKLDLNRLMRQGCIAPGAYSVWRSVWTSSYTGEEIASADFKAHMDQHEGRLRMNMDGAEHTIFLAPRPRNFGGHQWYFVCPLMNRCASVLWMPPGATHFRCRQGWGRSVAYVSQFLDPDNRAQRGKAKIKGKLIADLDPDEWELPPKPKWIGWATYNRLVEKFDSYDEILDSGIAELMAKLLGKQS